MTASRKIARRTRFFLGCEGKSEEIYAQFIGDLAKNGGLSVALKICKFDGGDPSVIADNAIKECMKEDSDTDRFQAKALFLDSDRLNDMETSMRKTMMRRLKENGFTTIWQRPDHEGFLLRHFKGHESDCPARGQSLRALKGVWPKYDKGKMTRRDYTNNITLDDVAQVANRHTGLKSFLRSIGLMELVCRTRNR